MKKKALLFYKKMTSIFSPLNKHSSQRPNNKIIRINDVPRKDGPIFDQPFYAALTKAELDHLRYLNLSPGGNRLIDLGCGVGRFSKFFVDLGYDVFCVDGRTENIQTLLEEYPTFKTAVVDVESDAILQCGRFSTVFCYGLLYHLIDPMGFLKKVYQICEEKLIISTCVTDADAPILRLVLEDRANPTQALHGMGCRPSPSYIIACLRACGFKYIYQPSILPNHIEYQYQRLNDLSYLRNGKLMRGIFIASNLELKNSKLVSCG
jgi:SAM-dependent methyltransferase